MQGTQRQAVQPPVIVTGSSGIIGTALIKKLVSQYPMIGFDNPGPPYPPVEAECISVSITELESIEHGLERVRFAYGERIASVVHLAAYYDFSGEPSNLYEEITVRGTERLLRALQPFEVEQFIFSSTMLIHEPTEPGQPITETSPVKGSWDYPQSKIDTEQIIHEHHGDIPVVMMRIAGVYTDVCDSIPLAHQIQRIYEKQITGWVFPGDVSRGQAFVHLEDTVDAIIHAIERRQTLPKELALLIGEPETYSYDQLQRTFARLLHGDADWTTQQIPKAVAKTGAWVQDKIPGMSDPFIKPWMIDLADDHYELDISRAQTLLDWQPRHRLIDALPRMIEALKADPAAWYKRHELELPSDLEQQKSSA